MKTKEKILIVEDEVLVAMALQLELENAGFEVTGLESSGPGAVEAVRRTPPSIILMDINLTGSMNGIEAAKLIRETSSVPVIFLSGYRDDSLKHTAVEIEHSLYINKPALIDDIIKALTTLKPSL